MAKSSALAMDCSRRPSFFKVFFPELSAEYMTIPPAFSKHMETHPNNSVVSLQGPSGRVWRVHLVNDSGGLRFYKGWKDFLADHSIVLGDFLLFRYHRTLHFTVSVFDCTACEKMSAFSATPKQVLEDTNPEPDQKGKEQNASNGVALKSEDDCIAMKRGRRTTLAPKKYGSSSLPKSKTLLPSTSNGAGRGRGSKLSVQGKHKKKAHCIAKSKTCVNQVSKIDPWSTSLLSSICNNPQQFNDLTSIKMKRLLAMVEELRQESQLSQRQPVTEQEMSKALQMANSFKSRNPFIIIVMRESYVSKSSLHFPCGFTAEHLPMEEENMTIWDPEGEPWPVKYSPYNNYGRFLSGWRTFSRAHNLQLHDVCVFELIQINQMKVHIFRHHHSV